MRKTYDGLAGFWPTQTGDWADQLIPMPKLVTSRTVHPAVWGRGERPFEGEEQIRLELLDAKTFDSGVMLVQYPPA